MFRNIYYLYCNLYNSINFRRKHVKKEKTAKIYGRVRLCGNGNLQIKDNARIISDWRANPIGGEYTVFNLVGGGIIIGENSGLSNIHITARESVIIGNNVNIGSGCMIYDNDFHSLRYDERVNGDRNINTAPIYIQDGAFIGAHSIILKGVTIGARSIVGAGSVVTKSIPSDEVWAGNPARFIKKL